MAGTLTSKEVVDTSTLHHERSPPESLATPGKPAHSAPSAISAPGQNQTPGASSCHPSEDKKDLSQQTHSDQPGQVADSSSTSTACTPYEEVGSPAAMLSPLVRDRAGTPRATGEDAVSPPTRRNYGEAGEPPAIDVKVSEPLGDSKRESSGKVESGLAPFLPTSSASSATKATTPGVKGTLQMSGVRAGDMKIALGDNEPFLRVKACDQLRRTNAVAGKGGKVVKVFGGSYALNGSVRMKHVVGIVLGRTRSR